MLIQNNKNNSCKIVTFACLFIYILYFLNVKIMIRIFIGYDSKETVAYHVLVQSILKNASQPVSITPLALHTLHGIYNRPLDEKRSTDFTFSRFYIPYLCAYEDGLSF
jgi:hypothetical protein